MSAKLVAIRQQMAAKQQKLAEIFQQAGDDLDFEKVTALEGTTADKAASVKALNTELEDLAKTAEGFACFEEIKGRTAELGAELAGDSTKGRPSELRHPDPTRAEVKTLGQRITEHEGFKRFQKSQSGVEAFELPDIGLRELKTLFQTSAGWAAETTRIPGLVIPAVTRPIQILDIVPDGRTDQAAVVFMEETTRTHAAAEAAEAALYAESTFVLTEQSSTVRKIGDSLPVTDEQMDDVAGVASYIDNRLIFGIRQRLDGQLINGNGTAPNLRGILNVAGIQTQAKGADPVFDAVLKAAVKVRVTGRAFPNAFVTHSNDWQDLRLTRTADGIYLLGNPNEPGPARLWGLAVVENDVIAENTGLVGDFANFCQLYERKGIEVQVGYVNDDFTKGRKTVRAQGRWAFATYRAAAFCTVTGI